MTLIESRVLRFIIVHFSAPAFTQSNLHAKPLEKNNNTRHAPQSSRSLFTESLASQAVECYSPSPTLQCIRHVYFGQVFRLALKQSNQTLTPMLLWTQFKIPLSRNLSWKMSYLKYAFDKNNSQYDSNTRLDSRNSCKNQLPSKINKKTTTVPKRRRRKPLQTTRQPNAIHIPRS